MLLDHFDSADAEITIAALRLGLLAVGGALLSFIAFVGCGLIASRLYRELADRPPAAAHTWTEAPPTRLGSQTVFVVLAVLLAVSAVIVHRQIDALKLGNSVAITAHRGRSANAPENSLSAIRQAVEDGADFAEVNIQETADGEPVRISGVPRKFWEVDYAEIRDLDAGSWFAQAFADERIATLPEVIATARGRISLDIELNFNGHDQRLAEAVAETVRASGFADHSIITSLNRDGLAAVRRIAPELRIGQIVTLTVGDPRWLDLDLLSTEASQATSAVVRGTRDAGLQTHVWTVNTRDNMELMSTGGVDNIITDKPDLLRQVRDARTTRSDAELRLLALSARLKD